MPAGILYLIAGLYCGTESVIKCGRGVSRFFLVEAGVKQGCILALTLFNTCMDWVLNSVISQTQCGSPVGNTSIIDLAFDDDAVVFVEMLEVLVMTLESLFEEMSHDLFSLLSSSNSESNKSHFHNVISACESDNSLSTSSESDCDSEDAVLMYMVGWTCMFFSIIIHDSENGVLQDKFVRCESSVIFQS